jgi:hypothetical protein
MKVKISTALIAVVLLGLAGAVCGQDIVADRTFDLPKMTQPPVLDGDRFTVADEWTGAWWKECSITEILREGSIYGWRDMELQRSEVSANQLNQSEGEEAAIALTDADLSGNFWHAWDDDAFYYIAEMRDNVRDIVGGSAPGSWWERDSISLYLDLQNEKTGGDITGEYFNLNIIDFVAAPMNSSAVTRTLEITVQNARQSSQEPEMLEGLEYGFRDAGDEYGGEADYCIEAKLGFDALIRGGNLPAKPTVGTEIGWSYVLADPDGDDAFGGQMLCMGWPSEAANYTTFVMSDTPCGPAGGTAVEEDSWARVKATFK